jgi:acyl-CoA oxidase
LTPPDSEIVSETRHPTLNRDVFSMQMFIPTIIGQGTATQKAALLPKCNSLEIIGTYAQTELGHGTFVRGLETTATYHAGIQQFIIHSPTHTATKWWPGGLGKTATHAVVMAQLFIDSREYGPHAFIVQLRCLETHKSMEGVTIGDIGPKFGYNGVDNGFLRFNHVLIPRDAMLSRFAQVHIQYTDALLVLPCTCAQC